MICPRCGTNNEEDTITCIGCGFDLRSQEQNEKQNEVIDNNTNVFNPNMTVNISSPYFENTNESVEEKKTSTDINIDNNPNQGDLVFSGFEQPEEIVNPKVDDINNNMDELMEKSDFDISKVINQSKEINNIQTGSVNLMNTGLYTNSEQEIMDIPKENVIDNKFDQKKSNKKTIIFIIVTIAVVATILTIVLLLINKGNNKDNVVVNNSDNNEVTNEEQINYIDVQMIYFNPVFGLICEDHVPENSLNENKTGCMRWYIYADDNKGNYLAILDHNTHDNIVWNSNGVSMPNVYLQELTANYNWKESLNPRLISADEIAAITGANISLNWDSRTSTNVFYFGLEIEDFFAMTEEEAQIHQTYHWLYDYTNGCYGNGCLIGNNTGSYGYWTSTPKSGNYDMIWWVSQFGALGEASASATDIGIRPVITISKEAI